MIKEYPLYKTPENIVLEPIPKVPNQTFLSFLSFQLTSMVDPHLPIAPNLGIINTHRQHKHSNLNKQKKERK